MPDQIEVSRQFDKWLNETNQQTCGLWASAGFGKSYSMKDIIEEVIVKNSNYIPVLASMTHSAVEVLADFTGTVVTTLHSLMGWVPYVDKETGVDGLSTPMMRDKDADPRLTSNMLVLIDEAGLMGHDELALLLEECDRTGARVFFVGDSKQCFPVVKEGQRLCVPAYEHTLDQGALFMLTIPKRVDEDDMIYKLSVAYRKAVDGDKQPKLRTLLNKDGSGKGVRHVDDIEELAYKAFAAGKRDGNMRNIKVLAYTNRRCLTLNRKIRKKIMGLKDPTPIAGEEMVANTTITNATGEDCLIRNNGRVTVVSVEKTESHGLDGAFIQFKSDDTGEEVPEIVFVPSTPAKLLDRLRDLSNDAKAFKANGFDTEASKAWSSFFSLKEGCADIRFTYAITVNKCQGTTLKHALVDLCDIDGCRDYEQKTRMAYTAVTRATDYCTIEGELTGKG
jgi:hypothetical protein